MWEASVSQKETISSRQSITQWLMKDKSGLKLGEEKKILEEETVLHSRNSKCKIWGDG